MSRQVPAPVADARIMSALVYVRQERARGKVVITL
jgi:hypothetical protein